MAQALVRWSRSPLRAASPEPLDGYQYFPLVLTFERAGQMEIEIYVEEPH